MRKVRTAYDVILDIRGIISSFDPLLWADDNHTSDALAFEWSEEVRSRMVRLQNLCSSLEHILGITDGYERGALAYEEERGGHSAAE